MRVGIIGGGISGLSAALRLARRGHEVHLFQREPDLGGLIATFDLAGTRIEHFYHFLCAGDVGYFDLCRELGIDRRLRFVKPRTGFYHEGSAFGFTTALDLLRFSPIPFSQRLRFGLFALEARLRREWAQLDRLTARPWLVDRLGQRAYDVIWDPLLTLKFGSDAGRISAAWVWHRIHRVARSGRRMGYLEGGTGLLLDSLTNALRTAGVRIYPGQPVAQICTHSDRVHGLRLGDGSEHAFERVVSTVPLSVLAALLPPGWDEYAERLRKIRYIGVACVSLKLRRRVTRYFWLNVHDKRIPFNGIIEFTNLNPLDGEHIAYVPYYVPTDSATYRMATADLVAHTWRGMQLIAPHLAQDDLVASHVARAAYAQAICTTDFLDIRPSQRAPVKGLYLLDSVFLYPEDRTQSGSILKANECGAELERDV
jgi:protoporphyrinogen oxidase